MANDIEKKWSAFRDDLKRLTLQFDIVSLLDLNETVAVDYAKSRGMNAQKSVTLQSQYTELKRNVIRMQRWAELCESGELGVRIKSGDIDIMAPLGTTAEKLQYYKDPSLAGWPIVVAVGVVVVTAIVTYIALLRDECEQMELEYNDLLDSFESKFCAQTDSETCLKWLQTKETQGYNKRKSAIGDLKDTISKIGQAVVTGTKGGIALLIPLLAAYFLFVKERRK